MFEKQNEELEECMDIQDSNLYKEKDLSSANFSTFKGQLVNTLHNKTKSNAGVVSTSINIICQNTRK